MSFCIVLTNIFKLHVSSCLPHMLSGAGNEIFDSVTEHISILQYEFLSHTFLSCTEKYLSALQGCVCIQYFAIDDVHNCYKSILLVGQ